MAENQRPPFCPDCRSGCANVRFEHFSSISLLWMPCTHEWHDVENPLPGLTVQDREFLHKFHITL